MKDVLYIAGRYLQYNWGKTIVLVASISLILFVPAGLQVVVHEGAKMLTARAERTPLLIGPKGSTLDLTLSALYFKEPSLDPMPYAEVRKIAESGLAIPVPMHLRYAIREHRIVGTTTEYFDFRNFEISQGRSMALLGECVLGEKAARSLEASVGAHVLSSPAGAFDVAGSYPLKMKVVGILEATNSPDDDAVFVDIKTSWTIAGLAHGHQDVAAPNVPANVLKREKDHLIASPAVLSYTEITPENIDSFHFHGDSNTFPIDAILAVPKDRKSGVMLRGRIEGENESLQIIVPMTIINELLDTLLSIRDYVFLIGIALGSATIAISTLVFVLSIRMRKREIETMRKIGAPRKRLVAILSTEIMLVVALSILIAGGLTAGVGQFGEMLVQLLAR